MSEVLDSTCFEEGNIMAWSSEDLSVDASKILQASKKDKVHYIYLNLGLILIPCNAQDECFSSWALQGISIRLENGLDLSTGHLKLKKLIPEYCVNKNTWYSRKNTWFWLNHCLNLSLTQTFASFFFCLYFQWFMKCLRKRSIKCMPAWENAQWRHDQNMNRNNHESFFQKVSLIKDFKNVRPVLPWKTHRCQH